jgi:hypothetical protein
MKEDSWMRHWWLLEAQRTKWRGSMRYAPFLKSRQRPHHCNRYVVYHYYGQEHAVIERDLTAEQANVLMRLLQSSYFSEHNLTKE